MIGGLSSELLYNKLECQWFVSRTAIQQTGMSVVCLQNCCTTNWNVSGLSLELLYNKLECQWFVSRTAVQQTGMSVVCL